MMCPVCQFPHASVGIPCGSCGGTMHGSMVIAQSATPIVPDLPVIPQQLGAAIIGFAGTVGEVADVKVAPPVIVEEIIAPAVEAPAPVQAEDPMQQPESKRPRKRAVTVN